uniref:butyrophilin subfamily 3 member A2-like n=1 Tax=Semicossyphus pulcher TaxID=241346 RepID=UPI0037E8C23D
MSEPGFKPGTYLLDLEEEVDFSSADSFLFVFMKREEGSALPLLTLKQKQHIGFKTRELISFTAAQSDLICSNKPTVAQAGDDIILPCHLEPAINANSEIVSWTKPGSQPEYIHFHQNGQLMYYILHPSYVLRTKLLVEEMTSGNISLKISSVKISDAGLYICNLESKSKQASIFLTVGAVSTPFIKVQKQNGNVVLQCKSEGWYPEPEVLWLDGEGNLLSAGPTETVTGPDDLYTVSSNVTVENNNNFTCRVQQKEINQLRETCFHVSDDFLKEPSYHVWVMVGVPVATLAIIIIALITYRIKNWKSVKPNINMFSRDKKLTRQKKELESSQKETVEERKSRELLTEVVETE